MKLLLWLTSSFLAVVVTAAPPVPPARWSQVIVSEPFHMGDDTVKAMRVPKPSGEKFSGAFTLPPTIKPGANTSLLVHLTMAGISPKTERQRARDQSEGKLLARVNINGQEVAVLNTLIQGTHSNSADQPIIVRVAGKFLKEGRNEIEVLPGSGKGKAGLDDCELLQLSVESE